MAHKVELINAQLAWRVIKGASGAWVAVCDQLNLTVEGDTWREMQSVAVEAMDLLFETLLEDNELESFLRRLGWEPASPLPMAGETEVNFDIPATYELAHGAVYACN